MEAVGINGVRVFVVVDFCYDEYAVSGPLIVDDNQITVSSVLNPTHGNSAARLQSLNPMQTPMGWKPAVDDSKQWIQVNLGKPMIIRGITTRGSSSRQEWVTSYTVMYGVNALENFYQEPYGNVKVLTSFSQFFCFLWLLSSESDRTLISHWQTIPGNHNNNETATYFFKSQFQAQYIKIIPVNYSGGISLRFDVLVCQHGKRFPVCFLIAHW